MPGLLGIDVVQRANVLLVIGRGRAIDDQTRVAEAKGNSREDNDDTLKADEGTLVLDHVTVVAVLQLNNTVDAPGEDEYGRGAQADQESVEAPAKLGTAAGEQVADHVVGEGCDEGDEDDDLERQTGHGDVDTRVVAVAGRGRHGTACGLEDEADDVEGDEDVVEELGLEARQFGGKVTDRLGERDIDGSREEDGSDGETD